MTLPEQATHADVEPLHLGIASCSLSELFLVVGVDGSGNVTLPGLLGRRSLLEKNLGVGKAVHLGEMADVDGPRAAVLVADGQQELYQLMDLGVGVAPDVVEEREHVSVKTGFYRGLAKKEMN